MQTAGLIPPSTGEDGWKSKNASIRLTIKPRQVYPNGANWGRHLQHRHTEINRRRRFLDTQSSVGTDLGAFYSPNANSDWVTFDNGLPNVIVNELEIHVGAEKVFARS